MHDSEITCQAVQSRIAEDFVPEFTTAESEHLAACVGCAELLTVRLLREPPEVSVPPGFAARVRSRVSRVSVHAAQSPVRRPVPSFGFLTTVVVLLLAALVWIALSFLNPQQWVFGSGLTSVLIFCTLGIEIGGIGLWLGLRSSTGY